MPPTTADRLRHILSAIETVQQLLARKTHENFAADLPLRLAVERALEIVCEASHRLPEGIKSQSSSIDWRRMTNFGNLLRHAYFRVDPRIVFNTVEHDLPPLKAFAERIVREGER